MDLGIVCSTGSVIACTHKAFKTNFVYLNRKVGLGHSYFVDKTDFI